MQSITREQLASEGFGLQNPPIPIWRPKDGDAIRGYLLSRHVLKRKRKGRAFLALQLTYPCGELEDEAGETECDAGAVVAIWETAQLAICERLIAQYSTVPQGTVEHIVPTVAFELALIAHEGDDAHITYEIHARRVDPLRAQPRVLPPPPALTCPATRDLGWRLSPPPQRAPEATPARTKEIVAHPDGSDAAPA